MQCLRRYRDSNKPHPHITNAFKYLSSIIATLIAFLDKNIVAPTLPGSSWNYMRTTWVVANIISSMYKLLWDVVMDWSLMQFNKDSEHKLLRKELFFHPYFYYFSIVTNILARFFWIVVLLLKQFYSKYLTDQWIEFRATNEIPLPFEITRMINAKENHKRGHPKSEDDNNRKISLNPKNFLKHSISHVSSLLGHGFGSNHNVSPRKSVQQEHEYELDMYHVSDAVSKTNVVDKSNLSNGISNHDKDVVIDIKDDGDEYDGEMSPSMKPKSRKKTIVVVEDDEIPETPHLTTRFGDIFTSEPENQHMDNEKPNKTEDQEKK
ncbi:hypothetical protein FDP41_013326 [Naegleria fowleri]|uniref:EXS domain-containing protein n=1 Tax=Naegleria fowleri TaxID=5763 RepID=A0A6A5BRZ5_NAEFO|nr:uncharacterized protein FDP41_013326 [Naegleria fowleri]KAF0980843.1 hypothetical protein FDP41_013326 [Naegleria fowleri]